MYVLIITLIVGSSQTEGRIAFETRGDCSQALVMQKDTAAALARQGIEYEVRGRCVREQQA
jgi:hypothetical protein